MSELKAGTKIRVLKAGECLPYMRVGDIGVVVEVPLEVEWLHTDFLYDLNGNYWANFNNCGNPYVEDNGIWCVGQPDTQFEILGASV